MGKMLGDGSYSSSNQYSSSITFGHEESQLDYVKYTLDCMGNIAGNVQKDGVSGYGSVMKKGRSINLPSIFELFNPWIKDDKKTVPKNLLLNPISLAVLFNIRCFVGE